MSTEIEHAHAFPAEPGEPPRITGDCDCGMTIAQFLQLRSGESRTVGMRLDPPAETPVEIAGQIVITWPKPVGQFPGAVVADRVSITNAETGQPILTVTQVNAFNIHAKVGHLVVAELVTLADADGRPILDSSEINKRISVADNGDIATTTSWWHVAEMRVGE